MDLCAGRRAARRERTAAGRSARREQAHEGARSLARSCRTLLITLIVAGKSRQSWRANNHNQGMLCGHARTHARTHTRTVLRYVRGSVAWTTWYAALCPMQELHTRAKAAEAQLESVRTLVATRGDRHMRHAAMGYCAWLGLLAAPRRRGDSERMGPKPGRCGAHERCHANGHTPCSVLRPTLLRTAAALRLCCGCAPPAARCIARALHRVAAALVRFRGRLELHGAAQSDGLGHALPAGRAISGNGPKREWA